MAILGWIRQGDKASCGGTVVEGDQTSVSRGQAHAFQGASLSCRKNCRIAEGHQPAILPNGRCKVTHGMKTSGNCPLVSTLNGIDGVDNESGTASPAAFVPDGKDNWRGIEPPVAEHGQAYDEYFVLMDEKTGAPASNRFYRITPAAGPAIEGYTDADGRTRYAVSDRSVALKIEIGHQHEIQVGD
jgi:uncharacterized Zn-binding protein involved in type VI secretion